MLKLDSVKYKRYLDEMGSRYPFILEMVNLYKGMLEIWGVAPPDDLSPLFYSERLSKGLHMLDEGRVGDIAFTNTVDTARRILNLLEKQGKYVDISSVDTSTQDILEFLRDGLSREDRFTNIILKWILKPSFSYTLEKINVDTKLWNKGKCPLCYAPPGMALMLETELKSVSNMNRLTGEQRLLSCCFCGYRWTYAVVGCPACGNDRPERLGFFVAESGSDQGSRAVSCEECRTYIKTSFIRCSGDKVKPLDLDMDMDIEDVVTLPIDMMANQRGYRALCQGYPQSSCK